MTSADYATMVQGVIAGICSIIAVLLSIFVPRAIAAFERRTGVMVTDQEQAAVMSAVTTGVGLLQTKLDLKLVRPVDIAPTAPAVLKEAVAALNRVPQAAAGQAVTIDTAAAMIAARVDTTPRPLVPVQVVPLVPIPPARDPVPLAAGT